MYDAPCSYLYVNPVMWHGSRSHLTAFRQFVTEPAAYWHQALVRGTWSEGNGQ